MDELNESTHRRITTLCEEGDQLAQQKNFEAALRLYGQAFALLPAPAEQWEAATWILVAAADAYFLAGKFDAARDNLSVAMRCPGALGNPFIHMRLGQCLFELGDLNGAADELARAYMSAGDDIFNLDDPKYLKFLKTRIDTSGDGTR